MEALPQCIHFSQVLPTLLLLDGYSDEEAMQQLWPPSVPYSVEPGAPLYRDALGAQGQ